jgi:hypothetical protein
VSILSNSSPETPQCVGTSQVAVPQHWLRVPFGTVWCAWMQAAGESGEAQTESCTRRPAGADGACRWILLGIRNGNCYSVNVRCTCTVQCRGMRWRHAVAAMMMMMKTPLRDKSQPVWPPGPGGATARLLRGAKAWLRARALCRCGRPVVLDSCT